VKGREPCVTKRTSLKNSYKINFTLKLHKNTKPNSNLFKLLSDELGCILGFNIDSNKVQLLLRTDKLSIYKKYGIRLQVG